MALQALTLRSSEQLAPLLVCISTLLLATSAVVLRVMAHRIKRVKLCLDDHTIFLALFLAWVNFICVIIATLYGGVGAHVQGLDPRRAVVLLKIRIPIIILWHSALSLVKISLLLLYIRIFGVKGKSTRKTNLNLFQYISYGGIIVVTAFFLMVILEELLICRPLSVNWNLNATNFTCGDGHAAYIATGVINLLTDVLVIVLPIPQIWKLQMPFHSKIVLSVLFSFGIIICAITITRISNEKTFYWTAEDPTFTIWKIIIWSQLEPNLAITCACVPLMRPVFGKFFVSYHSLVHGSKDNHLGRSSQVDGIHRQTYTENYTRKWSNASKVQPYECRVVSPEG